MPSDCPEYPNISKYNKSSTRTLRSSGCGIFTIAHAIQWLTGENPDIKDVRDHCGNTSNYKDGMAKSAMDYLKGEYGISNKWASASIEGVKKALDAGHVIIAATSGDGDHYFLAVEYIEYNGDMYVHIIDSSTGSTLTRNYSAYWIDTLEQINNYRDICKSGWYGEGHDYWMPAKELIQKVLLELYK